MARATRTLSAFRIFCTLEKGSTDFPGSREMSVSGAFAFFAFAGAASARFSATSGSSAPSRVGTSGSMGSGRVSSFAGVVGLDMSRAEVDMREEIKSRQ